MASLEGRRILLGVTGGIAAYKSPDLVRRLRERGADVQVVMTAGAAHFVTPLTFQAVSGRPARSALWDEAAEAAMGHIELARWADLVLVAPATADFLARVAAGLADDLLTTICLATEAPLAVAPAMNRVMWAHPATRTNVETLAGRGAAILGPGAGDQACGEVGEGRMLEPGALADAVESLLGSRGGVLAGREVVVSAGPTREPVDPVRYLTNRSSGKMGFEVARAAARAGAVVTLVSGPVGLTTPPGVRRVDVRTAAEMEQAVLAAAASADIYVGAAAIADYRPAAPATSKIKKGPERMTLELERAPDVLRAVAASGDRPALVVGFAAETDEVEENARRKLADKKLDMIAANRVGPDCGFDLDENALTVIWDGDRRALGPATKAELAAALVELMAERLSAKEG